MTVCDHASVAWPGLARGAKDEREALQAYRHVRDQIRKFVQTPAVDDTIRAIL